ncbi:MAG: Fe-S cluster assembly protein SufD [Bacteroidota bacterium]
MTSVQNNLFDFFSSHVKEQESQLRAWELLKEIGFPGTKSEAYKFSNVTAALNRQIVAEYSAPLELPEFYATQGSHILIKGGQIDYERSKIKTDLQIKESAPSEGKHDPFSLLNEACAINQIEIKSSAKDPVFLYHVSESGVNQPRIKVSVDENSSLDVIETFGKMDSVLFSNSYIEFDIAKNARASHSKVQNYKRNGIFHESVLANVARDAKFYNNTFSFEGRLIRNNLTINLQGENSEGYMYGAFILDKKSQVDNNTSVDHQVPNCYSDEMYKGILDEKSTGVFNGKIYVRKDAQKTNAFQANNNVLLSNDATIHTKPQLEIWADDVKCSHGCTSGQLDEEAIFYLRARGIAEKQAKAMILNAFAAESLNHLSIEVLRDEITNLIQEKLV